MKKKYHLISGEKISNNILNNSPSKQMYSFSKSERFPPLLKSSSNSYYNIPPIRDKRSCSFGYGNKIDFSKDSKDKSKVYYNIKSTFTQKNGSPHYSFGIGRDLIYNINNNKKNIPGPGQYSILKPFGSNGKKFSIYSKILNKHLNNYPGPGKYKNILGISTKGIYPISDMRNIHSMFFGKNPNDRFSYRNLLHDVNVPGPGNYNQKSLFGKVFNSRYKSNNAYTFSHKIKYIDSRENYPGPGSYNNFSEFSTYEVDYGSSKSSKKIHKCSSENNIVKRIKIISKNNSNLNSSVLNTIDESNFNLNNNVIKDYTDKNK